MKRNILIYLFITGVYFGIATANEERVGAKSVFYGLDKSSGVIHTPVNRPLGKKTHQATRPKKTRQATRRPKKTRQATRPKKTRQATRPKKTHQATRPKKTHQATRPKKTYSPQPQLATSTQNYKGIKYWIDLQRGNKLMRVSPNFTFRSGDRFKLGVMSNQDGYVYVVNKGTTGQNHVLHPKNNTGDNGFIAASTPYLLPFGDGMMRFDNNPGVEVLTVAFSGQSRQVNTGNPQRVRPSGYPLDSYQTIADTCGSKDILTTETCHQTGSKDIFNENDEQGDVTGRDHPAGYAVAPVHYLQQGKAIKITLKLKHQ